MTVITALSARFAAIWTALQRPELWKEVGRIVWDAIWITIVAFASFCALFAYVMVAIPYALATGSTPAGAVRRNSRR